MGELARTLVSLSGPNSVHGVIPSALIKIEGGYRDTQTTNLLLSPSTAGPTAAGRDVGGTKTPERFIPASTPLQYATLLQESEYGTTTVVPDMHTRKRVMANKVLSGGPGSGFVVLAGGFGTLEETMEMVTWNQLGIHHKGIVLLNIEGYWDGVLAWVRRSVEEGFVSAVNKDILVECTDVNEVMGALKGYRLSEGRYSLDWERV
jgi:uncharacterized protein (TIGR00730 family)